VLSGIAQELAVIPSVGGLVSELKLGDRQVLPIGFENPDPTSPLPWEIVFEADPVDPLERILNELENSPEPLLSLLPGRFEFEGGTGGFQFDVIGLDAGFRINGNRILLNGSRINYSDFILTTAAAGDGTARYATAKLPGLFVFSAELDGIDEFSIEGGPDSTSTVEVSVDEFTIEVAGTTWRAFIKRISERSSPIFRGRWPSINQMVLLPDSPGITRTLDPDNKYNGPTLTNLPASTPLHYFYFSRPEGATYDQSVFKELATTFLGQILPGPDWCQPVPTSGTIPAQDSAQLDLRIDADLAGGGTHSATFAILAKGTDPETLPPSAWQSVTLEVATPGFRVSADRLDFATLEGYDPTTAELGVFPAAGETILPALTVTSSVEWLTAAPLPNNRWQIETETSGLALGTYLEHLSVSDGQSTVTVPVWIDIESRSIISLLADPIRPRLYALSKLAEQPGFLIVHDTITQSESHVIAVGREPTDFDINEDASELIVLNNNDPSITRIDLESLTVIETIHLNDFIRSPSSYDGRIADGPGSVLYYTDEAPLPTLHVFDLSSRSVRQTFSVDALAQGSFNVRYSFGDIAVDRDQGRLFGWIGGSGTGFGEGTYVNRFEIAEDGTLSNFALERFSAAQSSNRGSDNTPVLFSEDGNVVFVKRSQFDTEVLDTELARFSDEAYSLSRDGELVGLGNRIYNFRDDSVADIAGSPPNEFTPDYAWFTSIGTESEIIWTDLHEIVTPADLGLRFEPADSGGVVLPGNLRWPPAREARSYQVYLGVDPITVAGANSGSAEFLGTFTGNSAPLPLDLEPSQTYHWRVVADGESDLDFEAVRLFTVLPVGLARRSIETTSVTGAARRIESFPIEAAPSTDWQLSSAEAWISAEPATGSGNANPALVIDASELEPGIYRGEVLFTVNGITTPIPVKLTVFARQIRSVQGVPGEDLIWVSSEVNGEPGFILAYDTVAARFEAVIPADSPASQFTIHPQENRIYVAQANPGIIRGYDRTTLQQVVTYESGPSQPLTQTIRGISSGPEGRLVVEILESNRSALQLISTENGNLLDEFDFGDVPAGSGVSSPDGTTYYYGSARSASTGIFKFDLTEDRLAELRNIRFIGNRNSGVFPVLVSADGTRVLWNGGILDADLNLLNVVPAPPFGLFAAVSSDGSFVSTNRDLYNTNNGLLVGRLPASSSGQTFDGSGETLYIFDRRVTAVSLSDFTLLPDRDVFSTLADGATVKINEVALDWEPESTAISYTVYFGADRDQVADADSSSPEFLGKVTSSKWDAPLPGIALGGNYYWRIDMQGIGQSRTGSVREFRVAAFETIPRQFVVPTLIDREIDQQVMSFRFTGASDWTAATPNPWIQLDINAGDSTENLTFGIDPTGLPVGTHAGSISITSGGETIEVSVEIDLVQLNFERFDIDPSRARIYGLNDQLSGNGWNHLIAINPETAEVEDLIRIGRNVTDLVIDPVTDRLIATNDGSPVTRVVDLAAFAELPPLELGDDVFALEIDPGRRLLIAESERSAVDVRILDLDSLAQVTSFQVSAGVAKLNPQQNVYYRAEAVSGSSNLKKYDLAENPPLRLVEVGHKAPLDEILMVPDGSLLVCRDTVYDPELTIVNVLPRDVLCLDPQGELAVSASAIHWLDDRTFAKDLPFTADEVTFTADGSRIVLFNRADLRLESIPLDSLIQRAGPTPGDGRWLDESPAELAWQPVAGASAYTITIRSPQHGTLSYNGITNTRLDLPVQFRIGEFVDWSVTALFPDRDPIQIPDYRFGIRIPQHSTLEGGVPNTPQIGPGHILSRSRFITYDLRSFDHDTGETSLIEQNAVLPNRGFSVSGQRTLLDRFRCYQILPEQNAGGNPSGLVFSFDASAYNRAQTTVLPRPTGSNRYLGRGIAVSGGILLSSENFTDGSRPEVVTYLTHPEMVQDQIFGPSENREFDRFGSSIAIHGNTSALTSDGRFDSSNPRFPLVYIFDRDTVSGQWQETQKLVMPGAGNQDSIRQLEMNDRFLVGFNSNRREVIIFERIDGREWVFQTTLAAADQRGATESFGFAMALVGNRIFIGDPEARIDAEGGVVFTYAFDGETWQPGVPIVPPDPSVRRRRFGLSLAARDRWLFVGAEITNTGAFTDTTGHLFEFDPGSNRTPFIHPSPVTQAVSGQPLNLVISAEDPDGNDGLVMEALQLPAWMEFTDLGNGEARLTGTPIGLPGNHDDLQFRVIDPDGASSYDASRLTLVAATDLPAIVGEPEDLLLTDGQDITLRSVTNGVGPLTWQWFRNDEPIPGATRPTLVIAEAKFEDEGDYRVEVRNIVGRASSRTARVTVETANRSAGPWAATGSSMRRSGFYPARLKRHTFVPAWSRRVPLVSPSQAAVADNRVIISGRDSSGSQVFALDLTDGDILWSRSFESTTHANPPSIHRDRIYYQETGRTNSSLWSLSASNGDIFWEGRWISQSSAYASPAVSDRGVWIGGGYGDGLYGFDLDGTPRFFEGLPQEYDYWTPILSGDRLFTWVEGTLREHDPNLGKLLWSNIGTSPRNFYSGTIRDDRAFVSTDDGLSAVDLAEQKGLWFQPDAPNLNPAVFDDRVYGAAGDRVLTFNSEDGTPGPSFVIPPGDTIVTAQPLLLHDHLIVSTENQTFIFDLETTELLHVIEIGGSLSYADGKLIIVDPVGQVHAWFANGAPEFSADLPTQVNSGDTAPPFDLNIGGLSSDPDPSDNLAWSIAAVIRPEIFKTLEIDIQTGNLTVIYNPWESGSSDVTLSVTDTAGNVTGTTITFTVPPHPLPDLQLAESFALNRRTGLYEHTVTVTNPAQREIAGFDLAISGLPEGVTIYSASPPVNGVSTVQQRQPLAAGASVTLRFDYYLPIRGTVINPQFTASIVTEPQDAPAADVPGVAINRCVMLDDGLLIEFTTTPGRLYEVQYSSDNNTWKLSPTRIRAGGNRVQWIDRGPPQTDSSPADKSARFYRVRELPESQ